MGYPVGPILSVLAHRILDNLDFIEGAAPKWGSPNQNEAPYADTQLLISLLGVLIFPHERDTKTLGALLNNYGRLGDVVTIVWPKDGHDKIELTGAEGESTSVNPKAIDQLPRLLRNGIAHFNVRPINADGRFGGIRIWNRNTDGLITFIGDVKFDDLRPFARFILERLAHGPPVEHLTDPPDPLPEAEGQIENAKPKKAPRIIDNIWQAFLKIENYNVDRAKMRIEALLMREAKKLEQNLVQKKI